MVPYTEALIHTAVHEAGHAVVDLEVGFGLLCTELVKNEEYGYVESGLCGNLKTMMKTKEDMINRVVVCYAGMAAEDDVLGEHFAGIGKDVNMLTTILEDYFTSLGYERDSNQPLINCDFITCPGDDTIRDKVGKKALECEKRSRQIITTYRDFVIKLAKYIIYKALMEDTLTVYYSLKSIAELKDYLKPYEMQISKIDFNEAIKDKDSLEHNIYVGTKEVREKKKEKKNKD